MDRRRQEPIFYLENNCPFCGHSSPIIYKPDLLDGPIECECQSIHNPMRVNTPCHGKWSVAIDIFKKDELRKLMALAIHQDELYREIDRNRKVLGYTE